MKVQHERFQLTILNAVKTAGHLCHHGARSGHPPEIAPFKCFKDLNIRHLGAPQQLHELWMHVLGFLQSVLITLDEVNQTAATVVRLQGFC